MNKKTLVFSIFILLFCSNVYSQTITEDKQEKHEDRESFSQSYSTEQDTSDESRYQIESNFGFFIGFDNNVFLDSTRKGDTFQNYIYSLNYSNKLKRDLDLKIKYSLNSLQYDRYTDNSSVGNTGNFALEKKLGGRNLVGISTEIGSVYYPSNDQGEYFTAGGSLYGKQFLGKNLYHRAGYSFLSKSFMHRKAKDGNGVDVEEERDDVRHAIDYEVGFYPDNQSLFKLKGQVYNNDSRDGYMDYYDYDSFKLGATFIKLLNDKWSSLLNYNFRRNNYKTRLIKNGSEAEYDNNHTGNAGIIYKLSENTSASAIYSYSQNYSNDSGQEYSVSMVSLGLRYAF